MSNPSLLHEHGKKVKCSCCDDYFDKKNFRKHERICHNKQSRLKTVVPSVPHPFSSSPSNALQNNHLLEWTDKVENAELAITDLSEKPLVLFALLEKADALNTSSTMQSNTEVCIQGMSSTVLIPMLTLHQFRESRKRFSHIKEPFSDEIKQKILQTVDFDSEAFANTIIPEFTGPLPSLDDDELPISEDNTQFNAANNLPNLREFVSETTVEELSANSFSPMSSLRVFYCVLLNWRLQHNLSQTAFNQLLRLLQELLVFSQAQATVTNDLKQEILKQSNIPSTIINDSIFDFNCPESLPSTESALRNKLNLLSLSSKSKEFGHIQCHNSMCGNVFCTSEIEELTVHQLTTNKIICKEAVYCDKCETPFHFDVLPECLSFHSNLNESSTNLSHSLSKPVRIPTLPVLRPQINSLIEWLRMKSKELLWWKRLDTWKTRWKDNQNKPHLSNILGDIWDGERWKNLKNCSRNLPLLDPESPTNSAVALSLHVDGFQAHRKGLKSITVIYLTVVNLPRSERFLPHNIFVFALIPGKDQSHCSTEQLYSVLDKLVGEILLLEQDAGVQLRQGNQVELVLGSRRGVLFNVCADLPASNEICGFIGHGACKGCHYCHSSFDKSFKHVSSQGSFYSRGCDYIERKLNKGRLASRAVENEDFNISSWNDVLEIPFGFTKRTDAEARVQMKIYENILKGPGDISANKKLASQQSLSSGVRYTPLSKLANWDHIQSPCLDVMHNIWLGVTKRYFKFLKNISGGLKNNLPALNLWIKSVHLPSDIGRMPAKWTGQLGYFKAIEMANWVTVFAIPSMIAAGVDSLYIFPLVPLQRLSFLLRLHTITLKQIEEVEINIRLFFIFSLYVLGPSFFSINLHLMLHIPDLLKQYGPPCNWWCFGYERMTGLINSFQRNETHVSASIMRQYQNLSDASQCLISLGNQTQAVETVFQSIPMSHALGYHQSAIHTIFSPLLPSVPSSFFLQSYIDLLLQGECSVDQQFDVTRKLNNQGNVSFIHYKNTKQKFFNMSNWIDGHEVRVKGFEPVPCLPKDGLSKLYKQSFLFSDRDNWFQLNLGIKKPPKIDLLTPTLLQQYYNSRYCNPHSDAAQNSERRRERFETFSFLSGNLGFQEFDSESDGPTPQEITNGDAIQLYNQMFICGELYNSAWTNNNSGGYIMSMFFNPLVRTINPWFGQIQFFFSHELNFNQTINGLARKMPVKHTFAFVKWFKPINGSTINSWKKTFSSNDGKPVAPGKKNSTYKRKPSAKPTLQNKKHTSRHTSSSHHSDHEVLDQEMSNYEEFSRSSSTSSLVRDTESDSDEAAVDNFLGHESDYEPDDDADSTTVVEVNTSLQSSSTKASSSRNFKNAHSSIDDKLSASVIKSIEERKQELDRDFSSISEYREQLSHVVLDRLQQDFPLISSQAVDSEKDMFKMILPIGRIWGRVAVWSSGSHSEQVVMHIPNRRHT